jgi:hypothetical protein
MAALERTKLTDLQQENALFESLRTMLPGCVGLINDVSQHPILRCAAAGWWRMQGYRQTPARTQAMLLDGVHGARFQTEIHTRGCHWIPRMFA